MNRYLQYFLLAALAAVLVLNAGCSSNPSSENKQHTLTVGLHTEPERLDPTWEATLTTLGLLSNSYETLVKYNAVNKNFEPLLAVSWKQLDDLTWEFTLRPDIKFHDGTTFSAEDVKYTIERMLDAKFTSRLRTQFNFIKSVEVVNEKTVKITTTSPYAPFMARMATLQIIGKASAPKYDTGELPAPAGTGPFKITKWDKQQQILIEKNTAYWGQAPAIDSVTLRIIPNLATRVAELKAGSIDIATGLTPDTLKEIKQQSDLKEVTAPSNILFIGCNATEGPLSNKLVRQALTYAIDSKSIENKLYGGLVKVLNGPVASSSVGYNDKISPYVYDPVKAKELLAQAGFPNGFTVKYNGTTGKYLLDKELAEIVSQQLGEIGVKVDIQLDEYGTYWKNFLAKKNSGLYNAAIGNPIEDADFVLDLHFYSKSRGIYFNTPQIDTLIEQSRVTIDPEKRKTINDELMSVIHDESPWVISLETKDIYATSARVTWQPGSYGKIYFGDVKLENK